MMTVSDICEAIGRKELMSRLDVTKSAVSNSVSDGVFPSSWYGVIENMCAERGLDCPQSLFKFRKPAPETPDAA